MRWHSRVARYVGASLLTLLLACVSLAETATADSGQDAAGCLALIGGPTGQIAASLAKGDSVVAKGAKTLATAEKYAKLNCGAYTQDYAFLALASALTALVVSEQLPNDYDAAKAKIDGLIAQIVADIVAAALSPDSPLAPLVSALPAGWLDELKKAIAEGATQKIQELLTEAKENNPLFAQFLGYFDCGLVVATGGAADQAKEALADIKGCSAFLEMCAEKPPAGLAKCLAGIGELGAAIAKGIADLPGEILGAIVGAFNGVGAAIDKFGGTIAGIGEGIQCGLNTCLTPGVQQEQTFYIYPCTPGWLPGEMDPWNELKPPFCYCGEGAKFVDNGLGAFRCDCLDPKLGYQGGWCGACGAGQAVMENTGVCDTCPPAPQFSIHTTVTGTVNGTQVKTGFVEDGICKPMICTCTIGDHPVIDPVTGKCACESVCQPGSVYPKNASAPADPGQCQACGPNEYASQGATGYTFFDPVAGNTDYCQPCGQGAKPGSTGCEPICKIGTVYAPSAAPLASGKGGKGGGKTAALQPDASNVCKTCAAGYYPDYSGGAAGSCQECAFGTTAKPGQTECEKVVCTGNTRLDPVGGHKCVPCKGPAGACVEGYPGPVGKPKPPERLPKETIPTTTLEVKPQPVDETVTMPARLQPGERIKGSTAKTATEKGGGSTAKTRTTTATGTPVSVSSPGGTLGRVKQTTGTPALVSSPSGTPARVKQPTGTPALVSSPGGTAATFKKQIGSPNLAGRRPQRRCASRRRRSPCRPQIPRRQGGNARPRIAARFSPEDDPMRLTPRLVAAIAFAAATSLAPVGSPAQTSRSDIEAIVRDYLARHPEEVQRIVKDYLVKHPELIQEALTELMKRRAQAAVASAADKAGAIKSNAKLLLDSPRQVTLGNRQGDVTMVEFLDYNCGFCKRALADMMALLKDDPRLRIVLKEWPVLGPASSEAARVAVAVRMQDAGGEKYLAFHQKLLGERGPANKARATAVAQEVGLDVSRLEQDMASAEVRETLEENAKLARALGINGTPGYVIGDAVVPGAAGAAALKEKIQAARGRPAN